MGRDPRQTPQSRAAQASLVPPGDGVLSGLRGQSTEASPPDVDRAVAALLLPFLIRDDGWLRIVPQEDGATVYWKWKWTAGPYRNCYVMTVYPQAQSAESLRRLALKVDAVDSGIEPPVKDHYFKG